MLNNINEYLDSAVLKPELTKKEAIKAIEMCVRYNSKTVCVRPCDILIAKDISKGTQTKVSCVLGFPHGVILSKSKKKEAKIYIKHGVSEIDMVVNYGFIIAGEWDLVKKDILSVTKVAKDAGVKVKAILETCNLSIEQITIATKIAIEANADFVKTSTGFADSGASKKAVQTMLDAANGQIKVKASGGIRNYERAKMFIEMGCKRLGIGYTSLPAICDGKKPNSDIKY